MADFTKSIIRKASDNDEGSWLKLSKMTFNDDGKEDVSALGMIIHVPTTHDDGSPAQDIHKDYKFTDVWSQAEINTLKALYKKARAKAITDEGLS